MLEISSPTGVIERITMNQERNMCVETSDRARVVRGVISVMTVVCVSKVKYERTEMLAGMFPSTWKCLLKSMA